MKILTGVLTILVVLVTTAFLSTIHYNGKVFAECKDLKNANVYCHEQYNNRSNNATTIRQTDEFNPQSCNDIICSLGDINHLESGMDTISNPLGAIIS